MSQKFCNALVHVYLWHVYCETDAVKTVGLLCDGSWCTDKLCHVLHHVCDLEAT